MNELDRNQSGTRPPQVRLDDLLKSIDTVAESTDVAPSFLEQLFNADAREQARMISKMQSEALASRIVVIEGLRQTIDLYIAIHRDDLRIRGGAHLGATLVEQIGHLRKIADDMWTSYLAYHPARIEAIEAVPQLDPSLRQRLIDKANSDLEMSIDRCRETRDQVVEGIKREIKSIALERSI